MGYLQYEVDQIKTASELMRAVSHELRLNLLKFIYENGPVHVNVIYSELDLDQSVTSQQLKILRENGLVKTTREGKFIYYTADKEKVLKIVDVVKAFHEITLKRKKEQKLALSKNK